MIPIFAIRVLFGPFL